MTNTLVLLSLIAVTIVVGGACIALHRGRLRQQSREYSQRVFANPANKHVVKGLAELSRELKIPSEPMGRPMTASDKQYLHSTVGQLYALGDELFPLLKQPLPLNCEYMLQACPALIHPQTAVLFGLRVGTYLCLLRLPDSIREDAISAGIVWRQPPTANQIALDVPCSFGPEWVVPNTHSPEIHRHYRAAFEYAARLNAIV